MRWFGPDLSPNIQQALDSRFMQDALRLGRRGLGQTSPNPAVGAVIVAMDESGPRIVGRGWTQPGGRPHAEAMALDAAGLSAIGATLYVTLEPCAHRSVRGATPCAQRIMVAGIRRVISALPDPNPHISGLGHALLRSFGLKVVVGERAAAAERDHRGHILRVTQGRPMVTVKLAMTRDGFAASRSDRRLMITGERALAETHLLRSQHDAIMVGVETVIKDDPRLDVRLPGMEGRSPVPVILDTSLRMPLSARLLRIDGREPPIVVCADHASVERERALVKCGAKIMRVSQDQNGRVNIREALGLLALKGHTRVFCEGGPTLADGLAKAGLIDELILMKSPRSFNAPGIHALGSKLEEDLRQGAFQLIHRRCAGPDEIVSYAR